MPKVRIVGPIIVAPHVAATNWRFFLRKYPIRSIFKWLRGGVRSFSYEPPPQQVTLRSISDQSRHTLQVRFRAVSFCFGAEKFRQA
jgi:phage-related protein